MNDGRRDTAPGWLLGRRRALRVGVAAGLAALGAPALSRVGAAPAEAKKKRILFYTRSQTFEHPVVKRQGAELGYAEKLFIELAAKQGWEAEATKDGGAFTRANLERFDAFFFYTTGDCTQDGGDKQPPMPAEGKQLLLEQIAAGKGFIASHCGADSFHSKGDSFQNQPEAGRDPYIRMLGGEFIRHGPQQEAGQRVVSPKFPGAEGLGSGFRLHEEWYSLRNFAADIHVILVQETQGMKGADYQRPDFPSTWCRRHEKGRVFYTSMGHREDVWANEKFQKLLAGGIRWVLGEVEFEPKPNLAQAAPEADKMPPRSR